MSEKYILGVDGGGTKTHCIIYGLEDNDAYLYTFPCSNHEKLGGGYSELAKMLDEFVSIICQSRGITAGDVIFSCFTLSGVDFPYQQSKIEDMIASTGLRDFILRNDTFAGIKANCEDGYGIAAVNGTGCCIAGINEKGESLQLGGIGGFSSDFGGAHTMIQAAVGAIYDYLYRNGKTTRLIDEFSSALSVPVERIPEKAFRAFEDGDEDAIRKMAIAVYSAADYNDEKAFELLEKIGDYYVYNIKAVYEKLGFTSAKVPVALIGTQFIKGENPAIINRIKAGIRENNLPLEVVKSGALPVVGSVLWAADMLGISDESRQLIKDNTVKLS